MKYLIFLILLAATLCTYAQERLVSGTLTDSGGNPLPGISITIKGTSTGTVTDIDGNYSIQAPIGSTLVFSGLGFTPREIKVGQESSESNNQKGRRKPTDFIPAEFVDQSSSGQPGIGVFTTDARTYKSKSKLEIPKINKVSQHQNHFVIKSIHDPTVRRGYGFQYSQVIGFSHITQTPELQTAFAQGRPSEGMLTWFGPDSNEVFSWGPVIGDLEYNGESYPYNKQGRLVPKGDGNGTPAETYEPKDFFKYGFLNRHDVMGNWFLPNGANLHGAINYETQSGVIHHSARNNFLASLDLENVRIGNSSKLSFRSIYDQSSGSLMPHGANISRIVGDLWSAPATFDPANDLSRDEANRNPSSSLVDEQNIRSYAPDSANNPFGLVSTTPDTDEHSHYFSGLEYEWSHSQDKSNFWRINLKGSFDYQNLDSRFGVPANYIDFENGVLTHRMDQKRQVDLRATPKYEHIGKDWFLEMLLDYQFSRANRSLNRQDWSGFTNSNEPTPENANAASYKTNSLSRQSHLLTATYKMEYDHDYRLNFGHSHYFSSTVQQSDFINFFPFIGIRADFNVYPFNDISPKLSYSRSIQESSLLYNDWAYTSTRLSSGDFREVYESDQLFYHSKLRPEIINKFEFDLDGNAFYRLHLSVNYSYETINDYIVPVSSNGQFELDNVGEVSNQSVKLAASYSGNYWGPLWWRVGARWVSNTPKVSTINNQQGSLIPLSGFNNAFSAFAPDQPLGMIYGTYYERNEAGELIIDDSGYPIPTGNVKPIGNPNPDWTLGFDGAIEWKNLRLTVLMEVLYGGKVWNGTAAYLDFLGRSEKTGNLRNTKDFIFQGVDDTGEENTQPVDFLDPNQPIDQNRWVRYGPGGVAEDYIEDASSLRLSELVLGYSIPLVRNSKFKEVSIALIGRNLFQVTPYSGVDPETQLFGNTWGSGLDMFNMPTIRSYQLKIIVKL